MIALLFLFRINSRLFIDKVLKNLSYLRPASGAKLSKIFNINKTKYKIGLFAYSTSNIS